MGKKRDRLKVGARSLPCEQKARIADFLVLQILVNKREALLKKFMKFFKLVPINILRVRLRYGFKLNRIAQIPTILIKLHLFVLKRLVGFL